VTGNKPRAPFPTKEQILEFIKDSPTPVGKREIARAFSLDAEQKMMLKGVLKEMKEEGAVARGRDRRLAPDGALPAVGVIDIIDQDLDGELIAIPATWDEEEQGPPPRILMEPKRGVVPKQGDRVLAKLTRTTGNTYLASPIRIIGRGETVVLGVLEKARGGAMLQPVDKRNNKQLFIPSARLKDAQLGEIVLARPLPGRRFGARDAEVVERIGMADAPKAFSLIAIHQHGIPNEFPEAAIDECDGMTVPELGSRADLRDIPLVTIDGEDARDFDDAVFAEPDDGEGNPGGFRILVAIADVAHYVLPGLALDRQAELRGNSVYFPDRVVPMLPEALSNELCSLKPGVERACMAVRMRITADGKLIGWKFMRGLMRSAARLTYERVQRAMDGNPDDLTGPLLEPVIKPLYAAYHALDKARRERQTLELEIVERRVLVAPDGSVTGIVPRSRLDSHKLIEEFMIAANVAAAEALEKRSAPAMYRIHEPPSLDKLEALRESLDALGYKLARGNVPTPGLFTGILAKAKDTPKSEIVSTLVLRSQSQARYSPDNAGHFGLALARYCHFTSPIRRYADVLVHRALVRAYGLGEGGLPPGAEERFEALGEAISITERRAATAEREVVDRYTAAFLVDKVGATFEGRIGGVIRAGLFVTLKETGADGLVPVSTLPWDRYFHDEVQHALVGENSGLTFTLGEAVTVRLVEAEPVTGGMIFEIIEGGEVRKPGPGKRGPARRPPPRKGPPRGGVPKGVPRGRRR